MSPEKMIELVLTGEDYEFSQELCAAFWDGFPIENLRPLLTSQIPRVQALGSYLVYELGGKARPLMNHVVPLLHNPEPQIRADAINCLGDCVTKFDADVAGRLISMLADENAFVQRIAMQFLQYCERTVLDVGVLRAAEMKPGTDYEIFPNYIGERHGAAWNPSPVSEQSIRDMLGHRSVLVNRFGVAIAARARLIVDETFLDIAVTATFEESGKFLEGARYFAGFWGRELLRIPGG